MIKLLTEVRECTCDASSPEQVDFEEVSAVEAAQHSSSGLSKKQRKDIMDWD